MKDIPAVGENLVSFVFVYLITISDASNFSQADHLMLPLQFQIPTEDSLAKISLRPWIFVWQMILYLFLGQGLLLAPVLELSIFLQSRLLDSKYNIVTPSKRDIDAALPQNRPDVEVMPVSAVASHHRTRSHDDFVVNRSHGGTHLFMVEVGLPSSL